MRFNVCSVMDSYGNSKLKQARKSAIADKPLDASANAMAWLTS